MNPAIPTQRLLTTTSKLPRIEVTENPVVKVSSEIPRRRDEDTRISLPRPIKPRKEEREKSVPVEPVKKNKKLSKQNPKKGSSKKQQKPDNNEIEDLGLKPQESVGCLRVCSTLILEVYQLLGGNLCDCH